jgi:hypothetical protein
MSQVTDQGAVTITQSQMVDRINDIAWQAHQGSVAAIIQILNEKLVVSGVRTRAMFAAGVLQLLCEAATVDQLEQSTLVAKIQEILDSIAPRNIRRVKINSRIVREEQLLWLEEINRDPENQLLWSQEITLSQPGIFKQLIQDITALYTDLVKPISPKAKSLSTTRNKYKSSTKKLILGTVSLLTILLVAELGNIRLTNFLKNLLPVQISTSPETGTDINSKEPSSSAGNNQTSSTNDTSNDPFVDAVRLANQASAFGKTAINATQWLEIAAQWQRASDLMSQVPPSHSRYQEAQIRTKLYREYSKTAQQEAEKLAGNR